MAFNAFSLLEDIVDENPKTFVINKKPKETVEKPQELEQFINYSPDGREIYEESIEKRRIDVEEFNGLCRRDKRNVEGWRRWLEAEKKLLANKDDKSYFASRDEVGKKKAVLDQRRSIQEEEGRIKEGEKGFLENWRNLVNEEKKYIVGWKRWVVEQEKVNLVDDRTFIGRRERWIREEEKAIEAAEKRSFETCVRWVKEEKEYIMERRRWIADEEKRIDLEKIELENEKQAQFSSLSIEDQRNILRQRKIVVNERKLIYEAEMMVKEEEKSIKEADKRYKEADRLIKESIKEAEKKKDEERKKIKNKHQEKWMSLSKEEKEKALKNTLFAHQKTTLPERRPTVPKVMSSNFDQDKSTRKGNGSESRRGKETEKKQNDAEVVSAEQVKDTKSETYEGEKGKNVEQVKDTKSETSEGEKGKNVEQTKDTKSETSEGRKRKNKKKTMPKKIDEKSEEEIREARRKEYNMMRNMKTLREYEEEVRKKKAAESEKSKRGVEMRRVEIDEEFKSMKIIGKKKEIITV